MQASISDGLFSASPKVALTGTTFITRVLPPLVCFYAMGVLVQLKGTRLYRLALLPVLVWFSWRSALVDMSGGDPMKAQKSGSHIVQIVLITARSTMWAFAREPYRRHSVTDKRNKSDSENITTALSNAGELMISARGIGWNWSRGVVVPKPTLQTDSRIVFVLSLAVRFALHTLCMDACHQIIRMLSSDTFGSLDGGSLFDHALPPFLGLTRAVFVSFLTIWMVYFATQAGYRLLAIVCVVLFQQHPSQWPPLFDSPWLSTSLTELWGRRWHQMLRRIFLTFGVEPFDYLFGKLGGVLGAFFVSGIVHDIELRSLGRGGNAFVIVGFWLMNGVGVVLERVWKKVTGKRVGGFWGRMWTFGWLTLWGVPMVNEWAKVGRYGMEGLPGDPSLVLVAFVRRCLGVL